MAENRSLYRDTWGWNAGLSALWFGNNWKWFILLLVILPGQVNAHVPSGEKNTMWGLVFMIGAIWAAFGPALMGGWSDRLGKRKVFIQVGMTMTVAALLWLGLADAFWKIAVGYLVLQVADDVMQGAYASLIPQLVPKEKQPKSSAILSAMNLFAQIGTAIAALVLSGVFPGQATLAIYVTIAIVNIACAATVLYTIRGLTEAPPAPVPADQMENFFQGLLSPWKSLDFRWVWISRLCMMLGFFTIQPYMSNFLEDIVGVGATRDDKVFSLFGLTITGVSMAMNVVLLSISFAGGVGALLSAKRMERWGLRKTIIFAGLMLGPVLLTMAFMKDFGPMLLLAMVFGFAHGTFLSADWAMGAATVPDPESLGKDMGIWSSSVVFAQIASGAFGSVIDGLNRQQMGYGYMAAFVFSGIAMCGGAQLVRLVKGVS